MSGSIARAGTSVQTKPSTAAAPPRPRPKPCPAPSLAEADDSSDIFDLSNSATSKGRHDAPAPPGNGFASGALRTQESSQQQAAEHCGSSTTSAPACRKGLETKQQALRIETSATPLNPAASLQAMRLPATEPERPADGYERMKIIQAHCSATMPPRRASAVVVPMPRKPQGSDAAGTRPDNQVSRAELNDQAAGLEGRDGSPPAEGSRLVKQPAQQQHKRSGFKWPTAAATGTTRAGAKAATLNERDTQLLANTAGPSAQPHRPRPSILDKNK